MLAKILYCLKFIHDNPDKTKDIREAFKLKHRSEQQFKIQTMLTRGENEFGKSKFNEAQLEAWAEMNESMVFAMLHVRTTTLQT